MKLVVYRFAGEDAVCKPQGSKPITIPRSFLPEEIMEGDVVYVVQDPITGVPNYSTFKQRKTRLVKWYILSSVSLITICVCIMLGHSSSGTSFGIAVFFGLLIGYCIQPVILSLISWAVCKFILRIRYPLYLKGLSLFLLFTAIAAVNMFRQ